MLLNERNIRKEQILQTAKQMMIAARTAPKTKGEDVIELAVITDNEIENLSQKLITMGTENGLEFFFRDANSVMQAEAIVLVGTHEKTRGLNCGYCGFPSCDAKPETAPCTFNPIDLGIAVGSACATAADLRVDTRVMFSAGIAAQKLNYLEDCQRVLAIPISATSKNPFFDRKVENK